MNTFDDIGAFSVTDSDRREFQFGVGQCRPEAGRNSSISLSMVTAIFVASDSEIFTCFLRKSRQIESGFYAEDSTLRSPSLQAC